MIYKTEIERALDELISNEDGLRFQILAVVLAKQKWRDLIAAEPKKDLGTDAFAPFVLSSEGRGKVLACSLTSTLAKIKSDARKIRDSKKQIDVLIFATPKAVTEETAEKWAREILRDFGYDLFVMSRTDIVTSLMIPENAPLCSTQLGIPTTVGPTDVEIVDGVCAATSQVIADWSVSLHGAPLITLAAVALDSKGKEIHETQPVDIGKFLAQSRRIVLEGPAGRGKTTKLIQLGLSILGEGGLPFLVDLPRWIRSRTGILEFIAGMPAFQSRGLDSTALARASANVHVSFLLNGWNEISEAESFAGLEVVKELERSFPSAGIIVATRTHHVRPPLAGGLRTRIQPLSRTQRADYVLRRLAERRQELQVRLDTDPVLDELTRTPLILAEVTTLFEAGKSIPDTKYGVLDEILRLVEESGTHREHLQLPPISGRSAEYLRGLAVDMTRCGETVLSDERARAAINSIAVTFLEAKQISATPDTGEILNTLVAHHVLERLEYPDVAFRFEHQQFQELFAASHVLQLLTRVVESGRSEEQERFTRDYVNDTAWAEPIRIVAERLGSQNAKSAAVAVGAALIRMALRVDPILAADLSRLCGNAVWNEVGSDLHTYFRMVFKGDDDQRQYALAGMLATGSGEFSDILLPLLTSPDEQTRHLAYGAGHQFYLSTLGPNWKTTVAGWPESARLDFVNTLIYECFEPEKVIPFALADPSVNVRDAGLEALEWFGSQHEFAEALASTDDETFDRVMRKLRPQDIPAAVNVRALAAYTKMFAESTDWKERLRVLVKAHDIGGRNLQHLQESVEQLDLRVAVPHAEYGLLPALKAIRVDDPNWVDRWVSTRIADNSLWDERWSKFVRKVPDDVIDQIVTQIERDDLGHRHLDGFIAILSRSGATTAQRLFTRACDVRRKLAAKREEGDELLWAIYHQVRKVLQGMPADIAVSGVLAALSPGVDTLELRVVCETFRHLSVANGDPLDGLDATIARQLRMYLLKSVPSAIQEEGFDGSLKADLASSLSQVADPVDLPTFCELIQSDIERERRVRMAKVTGGVARYANWHVLALLRMGASDVDAVLIDLLHNPEYEETVAEALLRLTGALRSSTVFAGGGRDYEEIWQCRANSRRINEGKNARRRRYADVLGQCIATLLDERAAASEKRPLDIRLKRLARILAALDSQNSAPRVFEVISHYSEWDEGYQADALETLLFSGVPLPTDATMAIVGQALEGIRARGLYHDQGQWLVKRFLCLLPYLEDATVGINKLRELLSIFKLASWDLREVVTALGHSRSAEGVALLRDIALGEIAEGRTLDDTWISAVGSLDFPEARAMLLGFIDDESSSLPAHARIDRWDALAARISELARREPVIARRLRQLSDLSVTPPRRELLAQILCRIGSEEAILASLRLIDDSSTPAVLYETRRALEEIFVERQRSEESENTDTLIPKSANAIRARLLEMAAGDQRRKKSAVSLLVQIEIWRLEYGRPLEPRHPDFDSGGPWPPTVE